MRSRLSGKSVHCVSLEAAHLYSNPSCHLLEGVVEQEGWMESEKRALGVSMSV